MTEENAEELENKEEDEGVNNTKVRFVIPQRLDFVTFVGRDIFAVAHDIYILFFNLKTQTESIYVANNEKSGDGVDCISGHKSNMFVFAEKTQHPRIFVVSYPTFEVMAELYDLNVNRYKQLCMMEGDLIMGFSGFPNYAMSVWSWRTGQKLIAQDTGAVVRHQLYMASRTHMLVCQCWGIGLSVWEVAPCYKRCLVMRRDLRVPVHDLPPSLQGICWTTDGQLYAIDVSAKLYSVVFDGISMALNMEWSEAPQGQQTPHVCSFGNGIIIYCPDGMFRALKKCEQNWKVVWLYNPPDQVIRLVSNSTSDVAIFWSESGYIYKITGESEEKIKVKLFTYKQRNITKAQILAPECKNIATIDSKGLLCLYNTISGRLVDVKYIAGNDISITSSPMDPVILVYGEVGINYGLMLLKHTGTSFVNIGNMCLTHQIVSRVVFSPSGREMVAAAMAAGHIFIFKVSHDLRLTLVRYTELGRGLADCTLGRVGEDMRSFSLVLFSDKYAIGERIICINAETGKDNKFAGKMQGPYSQLVPLSVPGSMIAVPHHSAHYHLLKLTADKGTTVAVKIVNIIQSGHELRHYSAFINSSALLTYGFDGAVVLRQPDGPELYDQKIVVSHRYELGLKQTLIDSYNAFIVSLGVNGTLAVHFLDAKLNDIREDVKHLQLNEAWFDKENEFRIMEEADKNYLELQEEKKVREEAQDYKLQREEVVAIFEDIQDKLVHLLEENLLAPPLHQLSLAEFNLHLEAKKERLKSAEREREEVRLKTEARIRAQDRVTLWIRNNCWDVMLTPRIKLFAIFSHYQVENYPVLPTQREKWPELQQVELLRSIEAENDADLFRPWEEIIASPTPTIKSQTTIQSLTTEPTVGPDSTMSQVQVAPVRADSEEVSADRYVLSGSYAHKYIEIPPCMVPQTFAFTFLQMNWLQHIVKLNVQNMRLWFNKQFDDLMALKKREVGLVEERNARLRFIISELNKLSDLRLSFHHLMIQIHDPQWRQEEQPQALIKVDPAECSIPPYISPSQIVIPPVDPGPKDDFRERALIEMMDGVLEKLWHEEIKKPVPKPQCMLDKAPEHFTEDDLRFVFDYEAKVEFRNQERDKYRKMLHAEYAKLTALLNEGIVRFNMKVKDTWLLKLKVDSVIGQENLNLMRMRRVNLDRLEDAERLEDMRTQIVKYEAEIEELQEELKLIYDQSDECQAAYEAHAQKDKLMDRNFKNHFADLSPIIVDQCYKFFKKRPKWQARATMTATVLNELAAAVLIGIKPVLLHPDCIDYFKGVEMLDALTNMPAVMDEALWATTCRLRRSKIDNEIRMRGLVAEMAGVESALNVWSKAVSARRTALQRLQHEVDTHRDRVELLARNKTIQLVLPAGQVEIITTGHIEDFEDATLILREDIDAINDLILKVGALKLSMMRRQMDFRRGILAKEWEHAQMKMKLRHMEQELYSYERLKIPKELQLFLKNKELGYTEEREYMRMEKENEASKISISRILNDMITRCEELEMRTHNVSMATTELDQKLAALNAQISEKRLAEDPLEPVRIRKIIKKRMNLLVQRGRLIRLVQAQHTNIVLLQTELELLRLKTYPTLATFRTCT